MAGWLLVGAVAVIVTVIVLLPPTDGYPHRGAYVVDLDVPEGWTPPTVSLFNPEPACDHDWHQIDELVEHAGTASVLQVCTRCTNARAIPTTPPVAARQAGEDR